MTIDFNPDSENSATRTGGTLPVAPHLRPDPSKRLCRTFQYIRRGPPDVGYGDWVVRHVADYDPIQWPVEGEA